MVDLDFNFRLNGKAVRVCGLPPQQTLLDYIRSMGLTGAKEGCAEGECGACAVLTIKAGPRGAYYCPINSCLLALPMVAGQEILTVEGLGTDGVLSEVQRAMIECAGSQCGYCTPGFVVSMFAEYYRAEPGSRSFKSLTGNLCRCTGYRPIRDALLSVGAKFAEPHVVRLRKAKPQLPPIRYVADAGQFSRPESLDECLDLLASNPDARVVAGNTDLGVQANINNECYTHLVSVENLPELRQFRTTQDFIEIGCGLTLSEIEGCWREAPRFIAEWLRLFGSPLIRNRATLGGNLATASPIGDSAPMFLALDADVSIASRSSRRKISLASFFTGYRSTRLTRGDVLLSASISKPLPGEARFYKVSKRLYNDVSTVVGAISLWRDGNRIIQRARIAFGGVGPIPIRAYSAEEVLVGTVGDEEDFDQARSKLDQCLTPISDHRGSAEYRLSVARNLVSKFFDEISGTIS